MPVRVLVAVLFGLNVWRAITQAVTSDEAFTYTEFVSRSVTHILSQYDANHHVLHTLLCKLSISVLGWNSFTLRLPSLVAGLLYLIAASRLADRLFAGRLRHMAIAFLMLSPSILDYLSAARGYALALAFLVWALWHLLEERDAAAGPLLGLAAASNLAFAFPGAALLGVCLAERIRRDGLAAWQAWFRGLLAPAVVPAFFLVVLPLLNLPPNAFYWAAPDLDRSFMSLAHLWITVPGWLPAGAEPVWRWHLATAVHWGLVAVTLAAAAAFVALLWKPAPAHRALYLCAGTAAGALGLHMVASRLAGIGYPLFRTGLYLLVLLPLVALLLWQRFGPQDPPWCASAALLWAAPVLLSFALSFRVDYYEEWRYDAGAREIARRIRSHRPRQICASGLLVPALRYYRLYYRMDWLEIIETPQANCTAYVIAHRDRAVMEQHGLRAVYRHPRSGTVLALPPQ